MVFVWHVNGIHMVFIYAMRMPGYALAGAWRIINGLPRKQGHGDVLGKGWGLAKGAGAAFQQQGLEACEAKSDKQHFSNRASRLARHSRAMDTHNCHRSHFGSRYRMGCCVHAGLLQGFKSFGGIP